MPTAPSWLLNMAHTSPNLVDDSPEFRQGEQQMQANNMMKATRTAMNDVDEKALQEQQRQVADQMDMQKHQTLQQGLDNAPPSESPDRPTPMTWDEHGMPKQAMTPSLAGSGEDSGSDMRPQNPQQDVQDLAQATGLPPQVVASMALLGKQLGDMYPNGAAPQQPIQPPAPTMGQVPPTLGPPPGLTPEAPPVPPPNTPMA
jgi:hypothetical protein